MITSVFTSCGRFDLLEKTMSSFFKYADLPVESTIVIDNSTRLDAGSIIMQIAKRIGVPITLVLNSENIGQVSSIDKAYSLVKTEYIFHCEDDWEFFAPGFMKKSLKLLEELPNVITINLRIRFDGEIGSSCPLTGIKISPGGIEYREYIPGYKRIWHGFSWNPGLRRLSDYKKIGTYKKYRNEQGVGKEYYKLGYVAACFEESYCRHLGTLSRSPKANK